jgi:hypothetical protein
MVATTPIAHAACYPGFRWANGAGHEVYASSAIPSAWRLAVKAGVQGWNGVSGSTFNATYFTPGTSGSPSSGGWVRWSTPSGGFGGAPAVTLVSHTATTVTGSSTYFNTAFTWNNTGIMSHSGMEADVKTVMLHEMGHWLTLLHPSDCGTPISAAEVASVMHPNWTKKWTLGSDDTNAIAVVY